jgi:hypothetical protein
MGASKKMLEITKFLAMQVGQTFGRLTVMALVKGLDGKSLFLCQCACGQQKTVRPRNVMRGSRTQSCGCLTKEVQRQRLTRHGHSRKGHQTAEHRTWVGMINRCTNPNHESWRLYGGRGITVCPHWRESFEQFFADMGPKPEGRSIDRRDNDLGYLCPCCLPPIGNCWWATPHEQMLNRRPEWAKEHSKKMKAWWAAKSMEYKRARSLQSHITRRARASRALQISRRDETQPCMASPAWQACHSLPNLRSWGRLSQGPAFA